VVVFGLPLLLLLAAVGLGLVSSHRGAAPSASGNAPLALVPVRAPDAGSPACTRLLAAMPAMLTAEPAPLRRRPLAKPAPPGAAAWSGVDWRGPVVLRCGLPRPEELTPSSPLILVDGVSWLELSEGDRATFVAVDRAVYVSVTMPHGMGSGPIQTLSDAVAAALPPA
jgi:hypothetical protein